MRDSGIIRTHLKNRILVQDRGGAEFPPLSGASLLIKSSLWVVTGGILLYVEDLKRGTNPAKGGRPKDIFEVGSIQTLPESGNYSVIGSTRKQLDPSINWNGCKFHIPFLCPAGYQFLSAVQHAPGWWPIGSNLQPFPRC